MTRATAARYGAPLAFLAGVTAAVLLVRDGLHQRAHEPAPVPPAATRPAASTTPRARPRVYRVRAGDTLAGIAARFHTTPERLLRLNPGIQPAALRVGRRIRVG